MISGGSLDEFLKGLWNFLPEIYTRYSWKSCHEIYEIVFGEFQHHLVFAITEGCWGIPENPCKSLRMIRGENFRKICGRAFAGLLEDTTEDWKLTKHSPVFRNYSEE